MMILYHMSDSLKVGTELTLDYKKNEYLIDPFVKALNISTAMFQSMLLNADYLGSVLEKYNLTGMPAHAYKWAAEGCRRDGSSGYPARTRTYGAQPQ